MGTVWKGVNLALDLPVAIKLLHRELPRDERDLEYLTDCLSREARAAASLQHPAIVKAYDFGMTKWNDAYMAMELLTGEPLAELMARESPISPERAVQIMLPVAEGLDIVHVHGIVHRDLKPGNIFLAAEGQRRIQPKIVDFGIAKLPWLPPHPALPEDAVLGTPAYMAPEQARGSEEVDSRADVWSFCVVLYELVSGAVPFPGAGTQVFRALAEDPVPSLANRDGIDPSSLEHPRTRPCEEPRRQVAQHSMGRRSTR